MHRVRLGSVPEPPLAGHLPMGDERIAVTSRYLTRDGKPWIPVSGEFHYSRYDPECWDAELAKMKAGGITAVASYVIWLHHEQVEGELRFDGHLDVRRFAELCAGHGLDFVARIGPWVHAETRNGGLPDWLLATGCSVRTDDPAYLSAVERWYAAVAAQLAGVALLAVQIENELGDNPGHLLTLKGMAMAAGLRAPLWTATAWDADLPPDELLPLHSGYPDTFWDSHDAGWPDACRSHFFFALSPDDAARSPMATCELGGGMAAAYHRRPVVRGADVAALALVKLGSGSSWQGYYMYHGGTNPGLDLQESHATGYPNDLPQLTYDFQAPIGEHGQLRPAYWLLRQQHEFLASFGDRLAPMVSVLPERQPYGVHDVDTLRWALRTDGESGFLFVNNHQMHEPLPAHRGVRFEVDLPGGAVRFPPVDVPSGAFFVWPVNLQVGGVRIAWATAQPVSLRDDELVMVAVDGIEPQIALASPLLGGPPTVLSGLGCLLTDPVRITVLAPSVPDVVDDLVELPVDLIRAAGPAPSARVFGGRAGAPTDFSQAAVYRVRVPAGERLLRIEWEGDVARAYVAGQLIADQFYNGLPWEIDPGPEAVEVDLHLLPAPPAAPIHVPPTARPGLTRAHVLSARTAARPA